MKHFVAVAAGVAFVAAAGLAPSSVDAADYKLVCAHDQPVTPGNEGQREVAWQAFKKAVEANSKGRIEVQVIGASQLGDMPQILQNVKLGTVDCASIDAATSGPFIPAYSFISTPFVIESKKHADLLVDPSRPFFKAVNDLVKENLGSLAMGAESYPPRNIYSRNKPVTKPEDLVGMKLRVMQSPIQVRSWTILGASPSPVAFAELYAALQSGVIDAAENPAQLVWGMKHYEQVKFYSLTRHLINVGQLNITERALNRLPADLKKVVMDAGKAGGEAGRKYIWDTDGEFLAKIKGAGVQVVEVDNAPFIAKIRPLHDELAKEFKAENLLKITRAEADVARKN